jgi:hypothetical protein
MNEEVLVRFDGGNRPLAVRYDGRIWAVEPDKEAVHWFSRPDRSSGEMSPTLRGDANCVENWRVQVRPAALSRIRAFHLQREAHSSLWRLLSLTYGE